MMIFQNEPSKYCQPKFKLAYLQLRHAEYETGASLILSLVMLLIILLIGISLANVALMGEKSSRNEHDRALALFSAESALIDAELDIENSTADTSRSSIFSSQSNAGFIEGCGKGDSNIYQGLCFSKSALQNPSWRTVDIADLGTDSASVQFGRFTGRTMPVGQGLLPSQLPRYIIELILDNTPGQSANATTYMYRITAIGFGSSNSTQAVVQSFYRKSPG